MKKTNAIRELEIHKIEHIIREYEVDEEHLDAVSVALKTNEDITKVFKTLVLLNDRICQRRLFSYWDKEKTHCLCPQIST